MINTVEYLKIVLDKARDLAWEYPEVYSIQDDYAKAAARYLAALKGRVGL